MARKPAAPGGHVGRVSTALQVGVWIIILVVAFFMQAVPFFLVLTMFNLAIGVTSGVTLILIPVAAFGMLSVACWIATKRTRNMRPDPLPQAACMAPYMLPRGPAAQSTHQRIIPVLQRWRWRYF